ncbi:MAG: NAD(P)/FAD-dependent oxidoreductase [Betaproteobacteria bacterium]|nr:NAD(P)/FAD-dependent oxidoreductase [Betaproteobacteria bacterium]
MQVDVIVIGAGAAGMMCAAEAGKRGKSVVLIDHYRKLGEKIRISGGGRCNFTNIHARPENYLSQNPHFCRSALARYTPQDFIKLVERHGIRYHEKTLGQLFCDDSATQIIDMLKTECDRAHVQLRQPCSVASVNKSSDGFEVDTDQGHFTASALVIATGGLSVPKIGATPFGYKIAEQFGLAMIAPRPALVPLSFDPESLACYGDLSGLSLDAEVSCHDGRFRESLLLTHRGLSGPSILQISSYWQNGPAKEPIHINLLPDAATVAALESQRGSKAQFNNILAEHLPRRLAQAWCDAHNLNKPAIQFSDRAYADALAQLQDWQVKPSGTLGYNKAEVTLGGVDTRELSSKTMQANKVPGLYFIGEVVDVTGHLGGFNFQWAWASAVAAGQAL